MPITNVNTDQSDVPIASVKLIGPSEVASLLVMIGGLLALFLGDDFGLRDRAQEFAAVMVGLATMGTSIARAIKHYGAATSNATVLGAQLSNSNAQVPDAVLEAVDLDGFEVDGSGEDELPDEPPAGTVLDSDDDLGMTGEALNADHEDVPYVESRRGRHLRN